MCRPYPQNYSKNTNMTYYDEFINEYGEFKDECHKMNEGYVIYIATVLSLGKYDGSKSGISYETYKINFNNVYKSLLDNNGYKTILNQIRNEIKLLGYSDINEESCIEKFGKGLLNF
jgi:hypothetical protein